MRAIREDDMVEVDAVGWELSGEQRPRFVLRKDAVKVVPTVYYQMPGERLSSLYYCTSTQLPAYLPVCDEHIWRVDALAATVGREIRIPCSLFFYRFERFSKRIN